MKLIIDIGKFELTSIVLDNAYTIKKIEVITLQDVENILTPVGKQLLVNKVVSKVRETYTSFKFKEVICVLPTQDILLKGNRPFTTESLVSELEKMDIYLDGDISATIGKPFVNKGEFIVPVSLYDTFLDNILEELDGLDIDIKFISPISRLMKRVSKLEGRVAIADLSFTKTKILIAENGVPVEYQEFSLSGKDLITILEEIGRSVKNALILLHDPNKRDLPEITRYLAEEIVPINRFLKEHEAEAFIPMGGLSALNLEDYIDIKVVDIDHLKLPEKLNKVRNKILLSMSCDSEYDLINDSNLEILEEIHEKYKDIPIENKRERKGGFGKGKRTKDKAANNRKESTEEGTIDQEQDVTSKKSSGLFKRGEKKEKPPKKEKVKREKTPKKEKTQGEKSPKSGKSKLLLIFPLIVIIAGAYFGVNYFLDTKQNGAQTNIVVQEQQDDFPMEGISMFMDRLIVNTANTLGISTSDIGNRISYDTLNRSAEIDIVVSNVISEDVFNYISSITVNATDVNQILPEMESIPLLSINAFNPVLLDDDYDKITIMLTAD